MQGAEAPCHRCGKRAKLSGSRFGTAPGIGGARRARRGPGRRIAHARREHTKYLPGPKPRRARRCRGGTATHRKMHGTGAPAICHRLRSGNFLLNQVARMRARVVMPVFDWPVSAALPVLVTGLSTPCLSRRRGVCHPTMICRVSFARSRYRALCPVTRTAPCRPLPLLPPSCRILSIFLNLDHPVPPSAFLSAVVPPCERPYLHPVHPETSCTSCSAFSRTSPLPLRLRVFA